MIGQDGIIIRNICKPPNWIVFYVVTSKLGYMKRHRYMGRML